MQDDQERKPTKSASRRFLEHCGRWLKSGSESYSVENPNFYKNSPWKIAIYCVHGTCDRTGSFDYFVSHTIDRLPSFISSIKVIAFENRGKGECIIEYAKQLKNQIVLNRDQDVILVGHSRGGLVLSYLTTYLAERNDIRVHLPYSLCAPYQGSYLALPPLTFFSKSIAQMQVDDTFLVDLSDKIVNSPINFVYVGASKDKVVAGNAYLPYNYQPVNHNTLLLEGETHLSAMSSPIMIDHFLLHVNALGLVLTYKSELPVTGVPTNVNNNNNLQG